MNLKLKIVLFALGAIVLLFILNKIVFGHENNYHPCRHDCKPSSTPTPTVNPCEYVEVESVQWEVTPTPCITQEVTPTPTEEITPSTEPTITPTANPTEQPKQESHDNPVTNNTTGTPSCSDLKPIMVQDIWYSDYSVAGGEAQLMLHWGTNPSYGKVNIAFGENINEWRYGLTNTDNDGTEPIYHLKPNQTYWFQVAYRNGCAVGDYSHPVDP